MPPVQLDLTWTIFAVFCFYSLYTPIVSFMWAEKGRIVFQNLREIPVVVFLYFLVPCLALFLLNKAYSGVQQVEWPFVLSTCFILGISFFVMLYILTVPDWPIGKLLQIGKVPVGFIRALLSVNVVGSLLIAAMCGAIIIQSPQAIQQQKVGEKISDAEKHSWEIAQEKSKSDDTISTYRAAVIWKIIKDNAEPLEAIAGLFTFASGTVGSLFALGGKKKGRKKKKGAAEI
jgi:hypothetical protein